MPDPRRHETAEGEQAQYDLLVHINQKLTAAHDAVNQIRDITGQLSAWKKRLKDQENATDLCRRPTR